MSRVAAAVDVGRSFLEIQDARGMLRIESRDGAVRILEDGPTLKIELTVGLASSTLTIDPLSLRDLCEAGTEIAEGRAPVRLADKRKK